jgi:hypothetical protein
MTVVAVVGFSTLGAGSFIRVVQVAPMPCLPSVCHIGPLLALRQWKCA